MLASAAALTWCALAPSFGALVIALGVLGVTTISGQILSPLAADLAADANRGRVVAGVAAGALIGILACKMISGLVAGAAGWRAIFALAACVAVVLAILPGALALTGFAAAAFAGRSALLLIVVLIVIGSAAATVLWSAGGWTAVTIAGAALCGVALLVWVLGRRGPLVMT